MTWQEFLPWAFQGLLGGILVYTVSVLRDIKKSIDLLNVNMATIVEKTAWHEREIYKMDVRIDRLEA